jgi:hypothetical protein
LRRTSLIEVPTGCTKHESHRSKRDGFHDLFVADGRSQQHAPAALVLAGERAQHIEAAPFGHAQIQYEHVRLMRSDGRYRRGAVTAARDNVEVLLPVEKLLEPVQDHLMIVDEHDADRH